jgi:hypothetical protein
MPNDQQMREALECAKRVFEVDLWPYIFDGPHYHQAVKDAHTKVCAALLPRPQPRVEGNDAEAYHKCGQGRFHPCRIQESPFGWGVLHKETGNVFALVGDKSAAFALAAALNGHWEAAEIYMPGPDEVPDSYFERFKDTPDAE